MVVRTCAPLIKVSDGAYSPVLSWESSSYPDTVPFVVLLELELEPELRHVPIRTNLFLIDEEGNAVDSAWEAWQTSGDSRLGCSLRLPSTTQFQRWVFDLGLKVPAPGWYWLQVELMRRPMRTALASFTVKEEEKEPEQEAAKA